MSNRSSRRGKRRQPVEYQEDETVDDLAYAASFAMMGPPSTTAASVVSNGMGEASKPNGGDEDENVEDEDIDIEIEIETDGSGDDSESDNDNPEKTAIDEKMDDEQDNPENDEDDDDDDEDHEELVKAIAAMEADVTEEEAPGISKASHKTQHEVDAYNTPIQELEQHLHFRLSVDLINNKTKSRQLQASDLKCAGTIKHHMAEDRTIVIESNPPVRGASLNPLDEGTLLLMKGGEASSSSSSSNNNNKSNNQSLIPLGRIFETFGPVTRPLYTIRLPEPIDPHKPTMEKNSPKDTKPGSDSEPNDKKEATIDSNDATEKDNIEKISEDCPNNKHNSETKNDPPPPRQVDNWGPKGKYTQLLQQRGSTSSVAVYFVEDEAKLIDTDLILRKSGKGCDASNVYDEEVNNKEEMYYSDDEKERQAKSRRKGSKHQQSRQPHQQPHGGPRHMAPPSRGFHQSATPAGFYAPPAQTLPQGFHQPPAGTPYGHPPPPPPSPYHQFPNYGYPPGSNPPPPPPPPGRSNQAPNTNSGPPPAYQY